MNINIECYSFKYSFSTQKKSWLTVIKDGKRNSPTDEFENIGISIIGDWREWRKSYTTQKEMQK